MQEQATSNIIMIRPVSFQFNKQTAESNAFMTDIELENSEVQKKALSEFDNFVDVLKSNAINVRVFHDTNSNLTPDSIFPNNWVSFHHSGKVVLYPMEAPNRRLERRMDIIESLKEDFQVGDIIDLSYLEKEGHFLEGTGSLVLDRDQKVAYACISSRTSPKALEEWQKVMPNYEIVTFAATDKDNEPIYHTNVIMTVGHTFAIVCLEAIKDLDERFMLVKKLKEKGKSIIEISMDQMYSFAGNMLLVLSTKGAKGLIMSSQAYNSLKSKQKKKIEQYATILHAPISTIETVAGGSVRCMMAEIHLPEN